MEKVKLQKDKINYFHAPGHKTESVPFGLQFYKSNHANAILWHTVRYMNKHSRNGELSHISISFWCGGTGTTDKGKMAGKAKRPVCQCCAQKYNQFVKKQTI